MDHKDPPGAGAGAGPDAGPGGRSAAGLRRETRRARARNFASRRAGGAGATAVLGIGLLVGSHAAYGQGEVPRPPSAPAAGTRSVTAQFPPVRSAGVLTQPTMRLSRARGEVMIRRAGTSTEEPAGSALPRDLGKGDVLSVRSGEGELWLESGVAITVPADAQLEVSGISSVNLLRGEIAIGVQPGREPRPLYVYGPPGSFPLKARDARVRLDGEALVITVVDGLARPGSPSLLWGPAVKSGEAARWDKGAPPRPAHPLLPGPQWSAATDELFLVGTDAGALEIALRWQALPGAVRYRVELARTDADPSAPPLSVTEVEAPSTELPLRGLELGSYKARITAIDDYGAAGASSAQRRILVAQVAGLLGDGAVHVQEGQAPQIKSPTGQPAELLLDGAPLTAEGPGAGSHRLRVSLGGLAVEVPLIAQAQPATASAPTTLVPTPAVPPTPVPAQANEPKLPPPRAEPLPPEDVLLGGVGEVPFDGVRSPWAGRLVTARLETTMSGAARIAAFGRFTFKNGLGLDAGVNLLRAAIGDSSAGGGAVGFGNITAAARSPALRKGRFALQAMLGMVAPLSGSSLDRAIEVDLAPEGGSLRPDVRPAGGGWRVEPAVLLGLRIGSFALITTQGASLRLGDGVKPAYAGGLLLHADLLPSLRLLVFSQWHLGYLGVPIDPDDPGPDAGGAIGGGLEGLVGKGRLGQLRLGVLGRAGIGKAGAAVYGRGTVGLQLGYRFR